MVSEFDQRTVELIPGKVSIPNKLELLEYLVDVERVVFDYNDDVGQSISNIYDYFYILGIGVSG